MYEILKTGNVIFLEIVYFPKDSHLCWKFRKLLAVVILQRADCGSICLWRTYGMFLIRQNRISWRKTCHNSSFFFTTNLPRTGPVLNPIFSGKMPAINNPGNRAVLSLNLI